MPASPGIRGMEKSTPQESAKDDVVAQPDEEFKRPSVRLEESKFSSDESCLGIEEIHEDNGVAGECEIDAEEEKSTASSAGSRLLGDPCLGVQNGDEETKVSRTTLASYSSVRYFLM